MSDSSSRPEPQTPTSIGGYAIERGGTMLIFFQGSEVGTAPDALLAVDFAHFVQNNGAFEAVAGHGLDVSPIFGVFFDVGINLRVHFRVGPKSGLIRGGGIAAGARWRWGFRFVHNDSFLFGLFFSAFAVSAGERAASRRRHSGKVSSWFWSFR